MAINSSQFTVNSSGDIRQTGAFVPGTSTRYSTLDLHAWLQDLADNPTASGDDLVSILSNNPSELAGKRNASRPMALTLLPNFNIDDATSQWFNFGSIEQKSGADLYTGLKVLGSLVPNSPIYILQNNSKITKYWADSDINTSFQILVKAKSNGTLIDNGDITVFSRKYGQAYSHFDANLAAGSEQAAALSTSIDTNVDTGVMTPAICAGYFSTAIGGTATPGTEKIALSYGDTTQDIGSGLGPKLYKGTITLNGVISVLEAYQALQWACSELSTITFNAIPGWRYRVLPGQTYSENLEAPFGSFAGGKWFVAQGWWLTGVKASDSKNYQLVSHDGTTITPPTTVSVQINGIVATDYVIAARDNAGSILSNEYTVSATAGASSVAITGLKVDTPTSGVIRINGDRYTYSGISGNTLTGLTPAIKAGGYTSANAFIPFIDAEATGTSISSANFQFNTPVTVRFKVRNAKPGTEIVSFESVLQLTESGGSGTAVRNADA